ncbi:hypothetical protein RvY_10652 [Ramazzottius varieornatus]|uniref:UBC core domain-containing protein n=1 Tax=Ramazzottius varieornatus TaxID=947166 RepID=A0A1D1VDF6_RAMVA|nr:hypothetical protein RvY_10652 [Ramazzottius varieornatus]
MTKSVTEQTNVSSLEVTILGPPNTSYNGGRLRLHISFPAVYPAEAPQTKMLTKIVSPFFTDHGDFYYKFSELYGGEVGGYCGALSC